MKSRDAETTLLFKELVSRTDDESVLEQRNPEGVERIPSCDVSEIHLIVGTDEDGSGVVSKALIELAGRVTRLARMVAPRPRHD